MVIGLTGPTGAGKSTVCKLFAEWDGIAVIDADDAAHRVVRKGNRCLLDLAVEFSPAILDSNGELIRKKLAHLVFTDPAKLRRLNEIMFPYIIEEIERQIAEAREAGARAVVLDAPTLIESGLHRICDKVVVVVAPAKDRLGRVVKRDRLTEEEALERMGSQHPDEYYLKHADFTIVNDGDMPSLRLSVLEVENALGL